MVKRTITFLATGIALGLPVLACERGEPVAGEPRLSAEIIWDLPVEEPSGLVALPDGSLLTVSDGPRGLVHRLAIKGDELRIEVNVLRISDLRQLPHSEMPEEAPDLEGITLTRNGRWGLAVERFGEVWEVDPTLGLVVGLWRIPEIVEQGSPIECSGEHNRGIEGVAFDPLRGELLAAHERCQPALVLFAEKSGQAIRTWTRTDIDAELAELRGSDEPLVVHTLAGAAWAGKAGAHLVLDRGGRRLFSMQISEHSLDIQGSWSYAGVFRERGLHRTFGDVEGIAVSNGALYLLSDPGDNEIAQLARFRWPPVR